MSEVWQQRAACKGVDTEVFFPAKGGRLKTHSARRYCDVCTVREQCLEEALANPALRGIWGGTSPKERRKLRTAA